MFLSIRRNQDAKHEQLKQISRVREKKKSQEWKLDTIFAVYIYIHCIPFKVVEILSNKYCSRIVVFQNRLKARTILPRLWY